MKRQFILSEKTATEAWALVVRTVRALDLSQPHKVTIEIYKESKSQEQRNGFHLLCKLMGDELGYSQEEIKQYAKVEVLGVKTVTISGITREVAKSSEKAVRDEYTALIEGVYRLAAQAGVILPQLIKDTR